MTDPIQCFSFAFHRLWIGLIARALDVLDMRAILSAIRVIIEKSRCLGVLRAREKISIKLPAVGVVEIHL